MAFRTSKTRIRNLVERVAALSRRPYVLDKDATGYRLDIGVPGGGSQHISPRYDGGEMDAFLQGMIAAYERPKG